MTIPGVARQLESLFMLIIREHGRLGEPPGGPLIGTHRLALGILADSGPLRLGALAERMRTTDATASRAIDALVSAELVIRVADERDRRGVFVEATRAGLEAVARRRDRLTGVIEQLLEKASADEVAQFERLLRELNAALEPEDAPLSRKARPRVAASGGSRRR